MQKSLKAKIVNTLDIFLIILSIIYIITVLRIFFMHYGEVSSIQNLNIYNELAKYNWKYWFEGINDKFTPFVNYLEYIDLNYLHTHGILSIVINFISLIALTILIINVANNIFSKDSNFLIKSVIFFTILILQFSIIQDSSIIWSFYKQLFTAYFFVLFSYYLLVKYSLNQESRYFYAAIASGLMIIVTTPNYLIALTLLLVLGLFLKIDKIKIATLFILIVLAYFIHYKEIIFLINNSNLLNASVPLTKAIHFILNYLGSLFAYMSYEPCIGTSSVISGIFILGTFLYIIYLLIYKKTENRYYWIIAIYLLFYILSSVSVLNELPNTDISIFKNSYMTPNLIAWSLISIFYLHYFGKNIDTQRRVLMVILTLIAALYYNQINTYINFKDKNLLYKEIIASLKLGITNENILKEITKKVYIVLSNDKKMTIFNVSENKQQIIKDKIAALKNITPFNFDKIKSNITKNISNPNMQLKGYIGRIFKTKNKNIYKLAGWVYDQKRKKVPCCLIVLNENKDIIGMVKTNLPRKDVEKVYGTDALKSGFIGYIKFKTLPKLLYLYDDNSKKIMIFKDLKKVFKN